MDSARQALRWSIPGLIFVFELAVFGAVWRLVGGNNPADMIGKVGPATALATLLAGVPIGFLLYQLYYRNYRPYGMSFLLLLRFPLVIRNGLAAARPYWTFVRRDRGAEILREYFKMGGHPNLVKRSWNKDPVPTCLDHEQISEVTEHRKLVSGSRPSSLKVLTFKKELHDACEAAKPIVCRTCRTAYTRRFRWNWAVVMAMLDYSGSRPEGASIKFEYAAGSDIYHALGAARTAIATAAIGSIVYRMVFHVVLGPVARDGAVVQVFIGAVAIAALAYVQYQVIHSAREQSSTNLTIRTAAALAWFSRLPDVRNGRTMPRPTMNGGSGLTTEPVG